MNLHSLDVLTTVRVCVELSVVDEVRFESKNYLLAVTPFVIAAEVNWHLRNRSGMNTGAEKQYLTLTQRFII